MTEFRYPKKSLFIYILGGAICLSMFAYSVFITTYTIPNTIVGFGFLVVGIICIYFIFYYLCYYTVGDNSLLYIYPLGNKKEIPFSNILSFQNSDRLILINANGKKLLSIDRSVSSFSKLKSILYFKTKYSPSERIKENFKVNYSYHIILLSTYLIVFFGSIIAVNEGDLLWIANFIFVSLFFFFALRNLPISSSIKSDSITVKYLWYSKKIDYQNIKEINLSINSSTKKERVEYLLNNSPSKKYLSGFKPDDEIFYYSILYHYNKFKNAT